MKFFYSHLLHHYAELLDAISHLSISQAEKNEARSLIDKTIHCAAVDLLLEHLHRDHHERILVRINQQPDDPSIMRLANQLSGKKLEVILVDNLTRLQLDILEDLLSQKEGD